jgi:mono/diheme cytochrome c family protein
VDNHLAQPKVLAQRYVWIAVALALLVVAIIFGIYFNRVSDPYILNVLAMNGDRDRGYAIFQINCAGCHGVQADGNVGPSLHDVAKHKSKIGLIEQVISGKTPPMPKFQPSSQEMADLLSYLEKI